jgi:molybdopterin/thiamine biosynthesis adenylyltransferase
MGGIERTQRLEDEDQFLNVRMQLGRRGFGKVEKATLAMLGVGGLGSNLALSLAGSGFRCFTLVDGDTVSRRNVPLSDAFTTRDVEEYKVTAVRRSLTAKYGRRVKVSAYPVYSDKVPVQAITEPDMLFLGVDDRWTRLAITNLRVQANKPYVNIGFYGWEAAYMLVIPHKTACWACLWRPNDTKRVEKLKREGKCPEPEPNVPGAVTPASVQQLAGFAAGEAVKFFARQGRLVQYYKFNVRTGEVEKRFLDSPDFLKPDHDCPVCAQEADVDVSRFTKDTYNA